MVSKGRGLAVSSFKLRVNKMCKQSSTHLKIKVETKDENHKETRTKILKMRSVFECPPTFWQLPRRFGSNLSQYFSVSLDLMQ